jgi:hypothetical protein
LAADMEILHLAGVQPLAEEHPILHPVIVQP